jgi:SAM-dependent methyltransferase
LTEPQTDQPSDAARRLPPLPPRAVLRYDLIRRQVAELRPRTIAEIGCGQGKVGARLAGLATYVGVEPDESSCSAAVSHVVPRGGTVLHGTHAVLPQGSTYDLVCAFEVLEHIEDDADALSHWITSIADGGHLMLSVPAFQDRYGPSDEFVGHFRRYEPDGLVELLRSAGLVDVSVRLYGWPLGYALEAVRNRIDSRKLARSHDSVQELTAASGRTFQPGNPWVGAGITASTAPFRLLQRARPGAGTGLLAVARRAS